MNQIRLNTIHVNAQRDPVRVERWAIVCTKCDREIRRGDCGIAHRTGSAQMMYKRILE